MAKTYRNLWPQVVCWENLCLAYRKCRRRKRHKPDAVRFDFAWESELLRLQRDLVAGTYAPGPYRHFLIHDPKRRTISAAPFRDRVVHHAVVNVLEPLFERRFIHDSYACRRGKGTHRALDRAQSFLRRHAYFLKTDVVKFFPSVDHEVLLGVLRHTVGDSRLLELLERILASGAGVPDAEAAPGLFPGDDPRGPPRPSGLPIGNLTSQFFANVLLDPVDHLVRDRLGIPGYVRYCDDLVLFADTKARLRQGQGELEGRLAALRLRLHANKTQVRPSGCGLKFLGFVLWPGQRRLQQGGLARFNRRLRLWARLRARGLLPARAVARSLQAWRAHLRHANTTGIRRCLGQRLPTAR